MKDKIVCLVGPSGSGKTTIAKELEKEGFNVIQSYTTRPPREPGEWGHIFSDIKEYINATIKHEMQNYLIAYQKLYDHHYWATKEQYKNKGTSIYVVDPKGAGQVKKNVKDAEVITILLTVDVGKRIIRLRRRLLNENNITIDSFFGNELQDKIHNYIRKRLNKDEEIFRVVKCDYTVDANREVKEVLNDIKQII